jgi:hypothetical protein
MSSETKASVDYGLRTGLIQYRTAATPRAMEHSMRMKAWHDAHPGAAKRSARKRQKRRREAAERKLATLYIIAPR